MPKSTKAKVPGKDGYLAGDALKPYPEFPLTPHPSGRWCKKVRGKVRFLGRLSDPIAALEKWERVREYWMTDREPPASFDGLTVHDACNLFIKNKDELCKSGELAQRTYDRYYATCQMLITRLGKNRPVEDLRPEDFQSCVYMAGRWGHVALTNEIQVTRSVFLFAYTEGHIDKPVIFGKGFKKPSERTLRVGRIANGPKLFTPAQIQALLVSATDNMRAMILLGINGALGNTEIAELPSAALDLAGGWLDYARAKTAVPRRIPLWAETIKAIRDVMASQRKPSSLEDARLLFVGQRGKSYVGGHKGYRVTQEFDRVAAKAKVEGRTFYDLRRTFQTIAEGVPDLVAVQSIMGHAPASGDMSARYRQQIDDSRLLTIANHVHGWLFGTAKTRSKKKAPPAKAPTRRLRVVAR